MLILTMREISSSETSPGDLFRNRKERLVVLATNLELIPAIERIKTYEKAYQLKYPSAPIEYHLTFVNTIPGSAVESQETLQSAGVYVVENLQQTPADF